MNTSHNLRRLAAATVIVALGTSLSACTTRIAAAPMPASSPMSAARPFWRTAPHWSQLHLCADDRVHTGASDSFAHAWRECVILMSLAEPPASTVR
jgi:hypothetical protein